MKTQEHSTERRKLSAQNVGGHGVREQGGEAVCSQGQTPTPLA